MVYLVISSIIGILTVMLICKALETRKTIGGVIFIYTFGAVFGILIPVALIITAILIYYISKSGGMRKVSSIASEIVLGKIL